MQSSLIDSQEGDCTGDQKQTSLTWHPLEWFICIGMGLCVWVCHCELTLRSCACRHVLFYWVSLIPWVWLRFLCVYDDSFHFWFSLCSLCWPWTLYPVQTDLKLLVTFLPQLPHCWDYRPAPPCPPTGLVLLWDFTAPEKRAHLHLIPFAW